MIMRKESQQNISRLTECVFGVGGEGGQEGWVGWCGGGATGDVGGKVNTHSMEDVCNSTSPLHDT
jgi:hypothetical protein